MPAGQLAHHHAASRPAITLPPRAPASCSSSTPATIGSRLEWAPEVVDAAFDAGWMLDPNGYLAPVGVMITATEDD